MTPGCCQRTGGAIVKTGAIRGFITADYAFATPSNADTESGVLSPAARCSQGARRLNHAGLFPVLLQAQSSKAKNHRLANAGGDTITRSSRIRVRHHQRRQTSPACSCF